MYYIHVGVCDLFGNEVNQKNQYHLTTEFYVPRLDVYTTYADMYTAYAMPYMSSWYVLHISRHMRSFSFKSPQKAPASPH